jgi:hypothetical protein
LIAMTTTSNYSAECIAQMNALTSTLEAAEITAPGECTLTLTLEQLVLLQLLARAEARDVEKEQKKSQEVLAAFERLCATA